MSKFDKLLENLESMTSLYERILRLARSKQNHIVSGDIDRLEDVIRREYQLAEEASVLERERSSLLASLIREGLLIAQTSNPKSETKDSREKVHKGFTEDGNPMNPLSEIRNPNSRLEEQRIELRSVIEKLQEVNQTNAALVSYSHKLVNDIIGASSPITNGVAGNQLGYFA